MKNLFKKPWLFLVLMLGLSSAGLAQISILNANVNSFNITPASLLQVNIMNTSGDVQIVMEADLFATDNTLLLKVTSNPFIIKKGMTTAGMNVTVASSQYGTTDVSTHIKTFHNLPSGKFHYTCTIHSLSHDASGDKYTEDVESENSSFMMLVFPSDHDTIDSPTPLLSWSHSDPFNIASAGDYYKMVVVKLRPEQSAEAGTSANAPIFMKTNLMSHQVQYPYDLKVLKEGQRYGWEVQKISNEVIVDKTEAWDFVVRPPSVKNDAKYAVLKTRLDASYFLVTNDKLCFRFDESYNVTKAPNCTIYDSKMKVLKPRLKNENLSEKAPSYDVKNNGYNRFEINLAELNVKKGYYTLEVKNEKNETFLLKFYVE
jgi:hypothetical protein